MDREAHKHDAQRFTFRHKAAAFVKGILKGRNPMVEVAVGGLACRGLTESQKSRYVQRLMGMSDHYIISGSIEHLSDGKCRAAWVIYCPRLIASTSEMAGDGYRRLSNALIEEAERHLFVFDD